MSDYVSSVARALRFWSRLPLPALLFETDAHAAPDVEELAPAVPVAGALIGAVGALVLMGASAIGLPDWPSAILAVVALVVVTGAMHEDALADVADGFGGGTTIERKLEIMRDPRLGSFGAAALILAIVLKVALLGSLVADLGTWRASLILIAAAAMARIAGLWPLVALPPARTDGSGVAAGRLSFVRWREGAMIGAAIAVVLGWIATLSVAAVIAPIAALFAAWSMGRFAFRAIGGQTGDVCGAATLLADLAMLIVLLVPSGI